MTNDIKEGNFTRINDLNLPEYSKQMELIIQKKLYTYMRIAPQRRFQIKPSLHWPKRKILNLMKIAKYVLV